MSVTITADSGAGSSSPLSVLSPWETSRASRSVIHDLIGGGLAVSLVAPRPRAGSMDLLYGTEADAVAALQLHAAESTFTIADTASPHVAMTYVVDGDVVLRLDEDSLIAWVVTVGYQEIEL